MLLPKRFILLMLFFVLTIASHAQNALPVIHAKSKNVSVRDGLLMKRNVWVISPEVRPDAYLVEKGKSRKVTFYTDLDSISFDVHPGESYDFIILLNQRDSAYTRITTVNTEEPLLNPCSGCFPVTLPFHFGRGGKMFISASINGSPKLDLMFDTGADHLVLSSSGRKKAGNLNFDGTSENLGFGGSTTVERSTKNTLEVGRLKFKNVPLLYQEQADGDGILGYAVFEKFIVQIDFDKKLIILHDSLPAIPNGYTRSPMQFRNNLPFVQAELFNGTSVVKDWVEYDSGSAWSLFVNQEFATANKLIGDLSKRAKRKSTGMGPHPIYSDLVRMPKIQIAGFPLKQVPVDIERESEDKALEWPILGMDVMKRLNVYIDYQHFDFYFKPNTLQNDAYNEPSPLKWVILCAIAVVIMLALAYFIYKRIGMRSR